MAPKHSGDRQYTDLPTVLLDRVLGTHSAHRCCLDDTTLHKAAHPLSSQKVSSLTRPRFRARLPNVAPRLTRTLRVSRARRGLHDASSAAEAFMLQEGLYGQKSYQRARSQPCDSSDISNEHNLNMSEPTRPTGKRTGHANNRTHPTHIRSFAVRGAMRMTKAQRHAYDNFLDKWSISYEPKYLELSDAFGRESPTVLEIGFGMGESTSQIALDRPGDNFLGVEILSACVGSLLRRIEDSNVTNVRLVQHDAFEVVRDMIAPASLAGVHIYFPDPWPKKRHWKRRLIQPPFVELLASRIVPGGYIHLATDWEDYAVQMLEVLSDEPLLTNSADGYAPRPEWRPLTKFEDRGLNLGHDVWDLVFTRKL
eukprot:gnl/TRDRNA2_/TRDRNA2_201215_c0_seq1.p1 gnl/TRDRNA2_/TRDRNA2_201215_c0~~gnl/TRDRNA2_/TRDRNA2_201215_c0_seq1.p1  ORF type:complete len:408 (+),score=20.89 gnl/TRDRNA2_/TRDRNA2_201215_c0_seq1:125-1225(+)